MADSDYWYVEGYNDGYDQARDDLLSLLTKRDAPGKYPEWDSDRWLTVVLSWLGVDSRLEPIAATETNVHTENENACGT